MGRLLSEAELEYFEHLLSDYQLEFADLEVFKNSNFAVIAGPAGAGKDTLRTALVKDSKYEQREYVPIISTTTRPPRIGEQDGREYHFSSIEQVKTGLLNRRFFQAALVHKQQVSCLESSEIHKLRPNQIGLSILIVQHELQLQNLKSDLRTIFLIPPDLKVLVTRMQANKKLAVGELARRLKAATAELATALERPHYYCLVSENIEELSNKADNFLLKGVWDEHANQTARGTMRQILEDLQLSKYHKD